MLQEKALVHSAAGIGSMFDFSGTGVNEHKSEMTIVQNGDALVGEYVSAVSSECGTTKGRGDLRIWLRN
jgi:Avidin family